MKAKLLQVTIFMYITMLCFSGCMNGSGKSESDTLTATILPIKNLIDQITGGSVPVKVLVPPGSSPETFEPTPLQIRDISDSKLIFTTGIIDFETQLLKKTNNNNSYRMIDLSAGIELIEGNCTHSHSPGSHLNNSHRHGIDPHIWCSPPELLRMAENCYGSLMQTFPDSIHFETNYLRLRQRIDSLDRYIKSKISKSNINYFLIYHPALTYYSKHYDIEQVSIEEDGKEPSAEKLKNIIDLARENRINKILYQTQFSSAAVSTIAKDIGAELVEFDPLAENVIGNLKFLTDIITSEK